LRRSLAWTLFGLVVCALLVWMRSSERSRWERTPGPLEASPDERASVALHAAAPLALEPLDPVRGPAPQPSTRAVVPRVATPALQVRVLDLAGRPLEGASVACVSEESNSLFLTDADGVCSLPMPAEDWFELHVEREGFVHFDDHRSSEKALEVRLAPAVRIEGRVLDTSTREPVPRAAVEYEGRCTHCVPEPVVTDAEGRYEIAAVRAASGLWQAPEFHVQAEGYPRQNEKFDTGSGESVLQHDFLLAHGLEVVGQVVDLTTRTPLEGVSVSGYGAAVQTDADGRFRLQALATGARSVTLFVHLESYCGLEIPLDVEELRRPVLVPLPRGTALEGTVRDGAANPVADALVVVAQPEREAGGPEPVTAALGLPHEWRWSIDGDGARARSGADGRYRIAALIPLAEGVRALASHDGFKRTDRALPPLPTSGETLVQDLALARETSTARIGGRITLNGKPVKATVHWEGPSEKGYTWARGERYELEHVEAGSVALQVRLDGRSGLNDDVAGSTVVLQVGLGEELTHDFELALPMAAISGHVRFADGRPCAGREVGAWEPQRRLEAKATSAEDGAYSLAVPALGARFTLQVVDAGERLTKSDVSAGAHDVDFVVGVTGELRYRVLDAASHEPLPYSDVYWRRAGTADFRGGFFALPDAAGWQHLELPRGPAEILVRADRSGYRYARATDVNLGATPCERVFELEAGRPVTFTLAPNAAAFPPEHQLFLVEVEAWASIDVRIYPDERIGGKYGDCHAPGTLEQRRLDFARTPSVVLEGLGGAQRFKVVPDDLVIEPGELRVDGLRAEPVTLNWRWK